MAESFDASRKSSDNSRRASVESLRRPSVESLKRASLESSRRSSNIQQENTSEVESNTEQGELPDSYIQSKFNRKGSQYRNAGWKSSHNKLVRDNSSSSINSTTSEKVQVEDKKSVPQALPHMSSLEKQVYIQQKFSDITNILKDSGVDEAILQKIKD